MELLERVLLVALFSDTTLPVGATTTGIGTTELVLPCS